MLPKCRVRRISYLLLYLAFVSGCTSSSRQLLDRAEASWRKGRHLEAIQTNQTLYEREPRGRYAARALLNIGNIYYLNIRKLQQAIDAYDRLTHEFPGAAEALEAHRQLADIYANEIVDLNQAIAEYDRILEAKDLNDRAEILYQRADALFRKGDYFRALRELRSLEEAGISGHLADQVSLKIGNIYQIQKKFVDAAEQFRKVLTAPCMECRRRAILSLADTYESLFDFDRAIETIRLLDYSPENEQLIRSEEERLKAKSRRMEDYQNG
jgi:outer membrane protein assembly factor BamD (BamD/ComL family)